MEDVGSTVLVVSGSEGTDAKGAAVIAHPKEKRLGRLGRGQLQKRVDEEAEGSRVVMRTGKDAFRNPALLPSLLASFPFFLSF